MQFVPTRFVYRYVTFLSSVRYSFLFRFKLSTIGGQTTKAKYLWMISGNNRYPTQSRDMVGYPTRSKAMVDVALDYGLQQLVDKPTRGENILDLFFTNNGSLVQHVNVKPGISDRDYVEIMCDIKPARVKSPPRKVFLWKKANYQAISNDTTAVDAQLNARPHLSCPEDVDANWNLFRSTLLESIQRNVPSKMTTNKCSQPWIDTTIRRGIRKKRKLFRKARKSNSVTDWVAFRSQRTKLDRQIRSKPRIYDWSNWCIAGDK